MKKILLFAVVIAGILSFASCDNGIIEEIGNALNQIHTRQSSFEDIVIFVKF
jgi:hypothetical protein